MEEELNLELPRKRFWELDFLRGICVILMIFDHIMFSISFVMPEVGAMFGTNMWDAASDYIALNYWDSLLRNWGHTVVVFIFFVICGTCCTFSRSNIRRGIICFLIGCAITFVTTILDAITQMGLSIYFGVLHMLGISMILYGLIDKLGSWLVKFAKTDKQKEVLTIVSKYLAPTIGLIFIIIFFACWGKINYGLISSDVVIEDRMSSVIASLFIPLEVEDIEWTIGGADYWPLLPFSAMVLLGGFLGRGLYGSKAKDYLSKFDGKWNKPICFVGKYAIIFYVLHQVAVIVLLSLITLIFG